MSQDSAVEGQARNRQETRQEPEDGNTVGNIYRIKERYGWKNKHSIKLNIPKLGMNEWPLLNSFRIAHNSCNMQVWRGTEDF